MTGLASLIRFFHLGALVLLVGAFGFVLLIARPAYKKAGPQIWPDFERFDSSQFKLALWSLMGSFLFSLLGLWLQIVTVTGRSFSRALTLDAIMGVLTGTQYGIVWIDRLGLTCLLAGILLLLRHEHGRKEPLALRVVGMVLAAALIMTLALSGHPAAGEGKTLLIQVAVDALHLLAAGIWLGGLLPLAILLGWARRSGNPLAGVVAQEATRRFSLLGLTSVSSLIVTGLLNAWNLVGGIAPLVGTDYGRLLLIKLSLLLPLMGLAALNLLRLKPRLLAASPQESSQFPALLSRLKRNVVAEASLGAIILLIVGAMNVTPPARHIQPNWPFSFRWNWDLMKGSPKIRSQVNAGKALASLGLLTFCAAAFRRRQRPWMMGVGLTTLGYGCVVALPALSIDAYPTTYRRPSVPYHAISVANGTRLYQESCAVCHGVAGYGDGPGAKGLKPKPANLTAKHTGDHTAGDLFWWLTEGFQRTAMPGFKDSLNEEERWDLINFIRTIAAAEQARPMAPLVEPGPWLVAPDFVYRTAEAEGKTLKDHRGESVILLVLFTLPYSQVRLEQLEQTYRRLNSVGVEVLLVPWDAQEIHRLVGPTIRSLPLVTDGSQEIFATYTIFRRTLTQEGTLPDPPLPRHMEFLIDRQGYVRARWAPGDGAGWANPDLLLREIDRLNKETPSAPAPDEHVH